MFEILIAAAAPFMATTVEDPITRETLSVFGTMNEEGSFGLICKPGTGDLMISVVPVDFDAYYLLPPLWPPLWQQSAASRFSRQEKAETDTWFFADRYLEYRPALLTSRSRKFAQFIDMLANDDAFTIRFEAHPREVETITFRYTIDHESLRAFLTDCGPQKIINHLQNMDSPAAP